MVSKSETVVHYSTVLLTVLIFLTDASAIATDYEKSALQLNKTTSDASSDVSSHRTTKLAPTSRAQNAAPFKNHSEERLDLTLVDEPNLKIPVSKFAQRELLQLSGSGAGENAVKNKSTPDDDDQKTLSQQVADGKYGLIQNEIFTAKPPRLGVISYAVNPEVPKDNANNLGGLEPDDIWLAENHLLVLAGGSLNGFQTRWRPIDNYMAPRRPVKLPPNPKVPPPFPVQLHDNGPVEYIKSSNPQFDSLPFNSFHPFRTPVDKLQLYPMPIRGKLPELSYFPLNTQFKPPPGAEFLPPYLINANMSDVDEDDPALYYPPPYDFIYQKDNTSRVPAGPLVPGIVLPPPPNFFSALLKDTATLPKSNEVKSTKYESDKRLKITSDKLTPSMLDTSTVKYDDILNEITYPRNMGNENKYLDVQVSKVRDKERDEWIPIPASKPFFITNEKTPLQSAILITANGFPDTYAYNYKKTNSLKSNAKKPTAKHLRFREPSQELFRLTTPPSSRQIVSTESPFRNANVPSTTPISPPVQPAIKATYYFYEEPREDDAVPSKLMLTSTPYIPSSAEIGGILPAKQIVPNLEPISKDEKKRKPITPLIPIYYLAELYNLLDPVEQMQKPYPPPSTPKTKPIYSIQRQRNPKPILEYNYVAAHYNNHQSQIPSYSTPARPVIDYNNYYHQPPPAPSQYQNIFNSIAQFSKPHHHTTPEPTLYFQNHFLQNIPPTYDHFGNSWLPNSNFYHQFAASYPTENPYHAFFTKEEANLVDDNTKEFFTVFGKKIKQRIESTTPLSVATSAVESVFTNRWKSNHRQGNLPTTTDGYGISYSSTIQAPADSQNTNKPLSLAGDTNVNYVTPLPPVNPDAEMITATFPTLIRPIVVNDLPADFQKRLNDIMSLQRTQSDQYGNQNYDVPIYQRYNKDSLYYNGRQGQEAFSPVSLHGDINVNFRSKLPIEPAAEYIGGSSPIEYQQSDSSREYDERDNGYETRTVKPISLQNDILINYKNGYRLGKNPDAEYIGSGEQSSNQNADRGSSSSENIISYKYPGVEHGHYYFLMPRETRHKNVEAERAADDLQSEVEKSNGYFKRKVTKKSSPSLTERLR